MFPFKASSEVNFWSELAANKRTSLHWNNSSLRCNSTKRESDVKTRSKGRNCNASISYKFVLKTILLVGPFWYSSAYVSFTTTSMSYKFVLKTYSSGWAILVVVNWSTYVYLSPWRSGLNPAGIWIVSLIDCTEKLQIRGSNPF